MAGYIEGEGTSRDPLRPGSRVRTILKALMAFPRVPVSDVKKALEQDGDTGWGVNKDTLIGEGAIGQLVRYRVSIMPKRHLDPSDSRTDQSDVIELRDMSGTCFISVTAIGNAHSHRQDFFSMLDRIDGVIEWDEIGGDGIDYLIRVAHKSDNPKTDEILRKVERHPLVKGARTMQIRRSRAVDNFQPEDFLFFADD